MCVCVTLSTQVCESVYVCSVSSILRSPTHQGTQECLVSDTLDHSPYHTTRRTVLLLSGRSVLGDLMPQQRRVFLLCCLLFFPNRGDVYFFSHFPGFFFRDPVGGEQDEVERVVNSLFRPNKEKKSIIIFPFVFLAGVSAQNFGRTLRILTTPKRFLLTECKLRNYFFLTDQKK